MNADYIERQSQSQDDEDLAYQIEQQFNLKDTHTMNRSRTPLPGTVTVTSSMSHGAVQFRNDAEHDLGNYHANGFDYGDRLAAVIDCESNDVIAVTGPASDPEARATARLFTVAPKMRDLLMRGLSMTGPSSNHIGWFAEVREVLGELHAADKRRAA